MADIWSRSGWGTWSYVDDDIVQPHNLVRHIARDRHIGCAKVDVAAQAHEQTWPQADKAAAFAAKANARDDAQLVATIASADLLIDATTTLEVPRDLSTRDDSPRLASAFLTPSGMASVLLLEDSARSIRLAGLEAQYYRGILHSDWGASHLHGHLGNYWVGAGCRDVSGILSQEVVCLHGANLARQIRLRSAESDACVQVWSLDEASGALNACSIPVEAVVEAPIGAWRVLSDEGLLKRLRELRTSALPNETGGVLLGYADQKLKTIHIVDALPAPKDSDGGRKGFTRGADGVKDALERAANLTANIVGYIGEWHSHPRNATATPSAADRSLLAHLAEALKLDGAQALMLIVGEVDISFSLEGVA
jgi:integrative and conjugative element protein (TIGR02256 family)